MTIQQPLEALEDGVRRIRDGDLDTPIGYKTADEFRPACDAVDEMAARLKASLDAQSRQQQQKQELIAGMSHDLKSPLTSIRAYTEGLLYDLQTGARAEKDADFDGFRPHGQRGQDPRPRLRGG